MSPTRFAASGETHVEEYDGLRRQSLPRAGVEDRAAAQGQDAVVLVQGGEHRVVLQRAERLLAVVDEQRGNGGPGGRLDVGVRVPEGHTETLGDQTTDGGLAGAGRAHEHETRGHGQRIVRWSR